MSNTTYRKVPMPNGDVGIEITEEGREPRIATTRPTMADAEAYILLNQKMDVEADKIERELPT